MDLTISRPRRAVATLAVIVSVLLTLGLGRAPALAASTSRAEMLALTNESRAAHGRPALKLNVVLSGTAKKHSDAMARAGTLFHSSNVPGELRPWHWSAWGENVGYTSGGLPALQNAFMHSPEHRANILNAHFVHVGIGVVRHDGYTWATLIFYG